MKITETITVERDVGTVWALFQDIPQLAHCLPGADITEDKGDGVYSGQVAVKLGPMTAKFEGEATVSSDIESRTGRVVGKGVDRSGGSVGQVKMEYVIDDHEPGTTRIDVDADVILSGAAAQFGRTGLINEMSKRLIDEFAACVEAKLEATTEEEAAAVQAQDVKGFSLFMSSLWTRFQKWIRKIFGGG